MAERHRNEFSGSALPGSVPGRQFSGRGERQPFGRRLPAIAALLAASFLTACGGVPRQSLGEMPGYAELASIVTTDKALVLPGPGGPAVTSIVQSTTDTTITQNIFLANDSRSPGENQITVTFWGPIGRDGWSQEFNPKRPTANSIYKEMQTALPGIPMHFSSYYVQNKYGPFGYAIGVPSSGGLCLYGWQLIRAGAQDFFAPNLKRGAVSIRLRYCRANVTERDLLQLMYDYTITGYFPPGVWNPFGDLPPADPTLGTLNNPTLPVGREGLASPVTGDVQAAGGSVGAVGRTGSASRSRPRSTRPVARTPVLVQPLLQTTQPAGGYPVVPPPPGSSIVPATVTAPAPVVPAAVYPATTAFPQSTPAVPAAPRAMAPAPAAPATTPRVVAPQITPAYGTAAPFYPTTTPHVAVPMPATGSTVTPAQAVPPAGLQNPYNQ